jgi:general secretion pathway protein G
MSPPTEAAAMKRNRNQGFTLIELMVVITIIGLLAGITSVSVMKYLREAKVETTKQKMRNIVTAIQSFQMKKNRIPSTLSELCGPEGDEDRFLEAEEPPKDAWGNDFIYNPRDKKNYDLISLGSDGVEGGEGDAADITKADLNKSPDDESKK